MKVTNIADLVIPGTSNVFALYNYLPGEKYTFIEIDNVCYKIRTPLSFKENNVQAGWNIAARLRYGKSLDKFKLDFIEKF